MKLGSPRDDKLDATLEASGIMDVPGLTPTTNTAKATHIFTPMTLAYGSKLRATSSVPITFNGPVTIWSDGPITIMPVAKVGLDIAPKTLLDSTFVQGWNKLPTELKMRILEFVLAYTPMGGKSMGSVFLKLNTCHMVNLILHYLRITPEISELAREAFYQKNTFHLGAHRDLLTLGLDTQRAARKSFLYPSQQVNQMIRRIVLHTSIKPHSWVFVRRLATGVYGFQNLRHITIMIKVTLRRWIWYADNELWCQYETKTPLEEYLWLQAVEFWCKGEVEVVDKSKWHGSRDKTAEGDAIWADLERKLQGAVTFAN